MKNILISALCALILRFPGWTSGLKEITLPEVGIYECTQASLGEKDHLEYFSDLHLELKGDGTFVLYYQEKDKDKKQAKGNYRYDRERNVITLQGGEYKREFPLKEGVLTVTLRIGEKTLMLTFEQK